MRRKATNKQNKQNKQNVLQKERRDSILSKQHSKINKTLETTFAICRCCCTNMVKNKVGL